MQLRDLPDIADLSAETQLEDEIVAFVAPYRKKYYDSYRDGFVRRIHARRLKPGWIYWVAETDEDDEPTALQQSRGEKELGGRVVGYAAWTRVGRSPVARNWQRMNEGWSASECCQEAQVYGPRTRGRSNLLTHPPCSIQNLSRTLPSLKINIAHSSSSTGPKT